MDDLLKKLLKIRDFENPVPLPLSGQIAKLDSYTRSLDKSTLPEEMRIKYTSLPAFHIAYYTAIKKGDSERAQAIDQLRQMLIQFKMPNTEPYRETLSRKQYDQLLALTTGDQQLEAVVRALPEEFRTSESDSMSGKKLLDLYQQSQLTMLDGMVIRNHVIPALRSDKGLFQLLDDHAIRSFREPLFTEESKVEKAYAAAMQLRTGKITRMIAEIHPDSTVEQSVKNRIMQTSLTPKQNAAILSLQAAYEKEQEARGFSSIGRPIEKKQTTTKTR
ncbi:hypothetical protein SAMN05444392_11426 [Seinonella peptonophila]|uniref:Uncharacterized protein n=1 Tax=Seinonella peptonophila TaxID=112248 RepID=A0A1M5AIY3_9BACL|nr:hypothetical protein [Seinonella peptonophila]SHF30086.1 hypothetical protein SAMN05444392_11426 [Seinonella peptonophila]